MTSTAEGRWNYCGAFLLCDPGWCVHILYRDVYPDVQNKWDDNTHARTRPIALLGNVVSTETICYTSSSSVNHDSSLIGGRPNVKPTHCISSRGPARSSWYIVRFAFS